MIVNRRTFVAARGQLDAPLSALREEVGKAPHAARLYAPSIGAFDTIAVELEFESLAEYEQFIGPYFARLAETGFFERWNQMTVSGGENAIWELVS